MFNVHVHGYMSLNVHFGSNMTVLYECPHTNRALKTHTKLLTFDITMHSDCDNTLMYPFIF